MAWNSETYANPEESPMNAMKREITRDDIMSMDRYGTERKARRAKLGNAFQLIAVAHRAGLRIDHRASRIAAPAGRQSRLSRQDLRQQCGCLVGLPL